VVKRLKIRKDKLGYGNFPVPKRSNDKVKFLNMDIENVFGL
jgi:hypothetical protein